MQAGKLKHPITIQKSTYTVNTFNEQVSTWKDFLSCRAQMRPLVGRERFTAQQVDATMDTVFSMRYSTGITPAMRIDAGDYYYDIVSVVDVDQRHRELILYARVHAT